MFRDTVSTGRIASPSLTATHQIAYFKSHFHATLVSNKAIKVDGWSGRMVIVKGTDYGTKIQIQDLLLAKGRVGYIIEMYGNLDSSGPDKALFKKIYLTWRPT